MKTILALIVALAVAPQAFAGWGFSSDFINGSYYVEFDDETLDTYPKWKPEDGNPPVSPRAARELADKAFAKMFDAKAHPGWETKCSSLELEPLRELDWVWAVTYVGMWKGYEFPEVAPELTIYVPMTGEAIIGKVSGDKYASEADYRERAETALSENTTKTPQPDVPHAWRFGGGYIREGIATVTPELLASTPDWKAAEPNPPLTINQALLAARPVQERWLPSVEKQLRAELVGISLEPLQADKWVWLVHYELRSVRAGSGIPWSLTVVVLMDGKAVEPVDVEPAEQPKP